MIARQELAAGGPLRFSIVIPVYWGARTLEPLHQRLVAVMEKLGESFEIILVDDGSGDDSWSVIGVLAARDPRVVGVQLMRNSGQANATMAGLTEARGELLITLDDDLQHPPEEIPKLIAAMTADPGLDMVIGVPEEKRHALWRNLASDFINWLSQRVFGNQRSFKLTTFRLLQRQAVEPLLAMNLPNSAPGALLQTITRSSTGVTVDHAARDEGRSGYTLAKMINLAVHKFLGFSTFPLRALALVGMAGVGLSLILGIFYVTRFFSGKIGVPGFTTLILLLIFISGLNFLTLGIFGEYLQQILLTVRRTPPFVVRGRVSQRGSDESGLGLPEVRDSSSSASAVGGSDRDLDCLAAQFGDSFYLFDVGVVHRNYRSLLASCQEIYPQSRLAYAYAASRLPLLGRRVIDWGGKGVVSSRLEYEMALRLGVNPADVLCSCADWQQMNLARVLLAGSPAFLSRSQEIDWVVEIAKEESAPNIKVGLRCGSNIASESPVSAGWDVATSEFQAAIGQLQTTPGVEWLGLQGPATSQPAKADSADGSRQILDSTREALSGLTDGMIVFEEASSLAVASVLAETFPDGGPTLVLEQGQAMIEGACRWVVRERDGEVLGKSRLWQGVDLSPPVLVIEGDDVRQAELAVTTEQVLALIDVGSEGGQGGLP